MIQVNIGDQKGSTECSHDGILAKERLRSAKNIKSLAILIAICGTFMILEVIGGILSGSLAILSDAAHLLSDIAGFVISLLSMVYGLRPATKKHSFGFHRAEILGALGSVAFIWILTGALILEAIDRIRNPKEINGKLMFFVALIGFCINIIMILTFHRLSKEIHEPLHRHKESEEIPAHAHRHDNFLASLLPSNLNIRSAFIHIIGDLIQSLGVLFASAIIWASPKYQIADPICTFTFSFIVLFTTVKVLSEAIHVIMEGTPLHIDSSMIESDILKINGVSRIHDLHIWSLSSEKFTISLHVVVKSSEHDSDKSLLARSKHVLAECQSLLCKKYFLHHSAIQVEFEDPDNVNTCKSFICCNDKST
ncbi:hypothetical protein MDAP_000346 [Mitosporidium daphniae]